MPINKNPDDMTREEKVALGINAIKNFFDSLGGPNDVYKQIVLEELMRFMIGDDEDDVAH